MMKDSRATQRHCQESVSQLAAFTLVAPPVVIAIPSTTLPPVLSKTKPFVRFSCHIAAMIVLLISVKVQAQSIRFPWSGYSHDPQHDAIAPVASQPLNRIVWQTSVDLSVPTNNTGELFIHYGSPLITRSNTVIVPVKTGASGGFEIEALVGATGATNWVQSTDYILPPHNWIPSFSPTLTPKNRLYFSGGGGTVYYCDTPDTTNASPVIGRTAFYGLTNYTANTNAYLNNVFINTPITSDRYGNIFFGFQVTGSTPLNLQSGIARIDFNGTGAWIAASYTVTNAAISQVAMNCAPALSNDHKTFYLAVNNGYSGYGYLVALDSRNLAPIAGVRLKDVKNPMDDADVDDDGTASPTVGPDGDVYYGVLETPRYSNNDRGWLLHFDSTLTQTKLPGAFGWDDTASIVPASMVPSYHGNSSYLLMTKYNNYADPGLNGDGVNKIAILDPQNSETDPVSGATVMNEVLTIAGPTPDPDNRNAQHPNAVREWCINSAAIDPFTKSVLANNEDGRLYRWDLTSNTFSETNVLTTGVGEAYTPTIVGVDGIVYAINNAILFAIGH
ncbi:MAG: hypothetical protein ABSC01_14195 [Verrucomicrobiota bacterium]